jgi:hypothetical protein
LCIPQGVPFFPPNPRPLNSPQGGATLQNGGPFGGLLQKPWSSCAIGTRSSRALFLLPAKTNPGSLFPTHVPNTPRDLENTTINHTALSWGRRKARRTISAATRGLAWRDDRGLVGPANPTLSHH